MSVRFYGLKYWKIIRVYFTDKYDISNSDLEMLLFLHGERYFSQVTFNKFAFLYRWDRKQIGLLVHKGFVKMYRGGRKPTYTVTKKTLAMINQIYAIMNLEQLIPEDPDDNDFFKEYDDMPELSRYKRVKYRKMMERMNEEIREARKGITLSEQHQPLE